MFIKVTLGKDGCHDDEESNRPIGQLFLLNTDTVEQFCPERDGAGTVALFRLDYDPKERHIHLQETIDDIFAQIDARVLASLGSIK